MPLGRLIMHNGLIGILMTAGLMMVGLMTAGPSSIAQQPSQPVSNAALLDRVEALLGAMAADRAAMSAEELATAVPFTLRFDETVRGLEPGAAVEFRGLRLGAVTDIRAIVDLDRADARVEVTVLLVPGRILIPGDDSGDFAETMARLVERGLRAELAMGSLLSGELVVALAFHPDAPAAVLEDGDPYPVIPSVPSELEGIRQSVDQLLSDLSELPLRELVEDLRRNVQAMEGLPLDDLLESLRGAVDEMDTLPLTELIEDLRQTVQAIEALANSLNLDDSVQSLNRVVAAGEAAIAQAETTLSSIEGFMGPDSELRYSMTQLMLELTDASRSLRVFADYVAEHPESLLLGKDEEDGF